MISLKKATIKPKQFVCGYLNHTLTVSNQNNTANTAKRVPSYKPVLGSLSYPSASLVLPASSNPLGVTNSKSACTGLAALPSSEAGNHKQSRKFLQMVLLF